VTLCIKYPLCSDVSGGCHEKSNSGFKEMDRTIAHNAGYRNYFIDLSKEDSDHAQFWITVFWFRV